MIGYNIIGKTKIPGAFNEHYDNLPRKYATWSDTNLETKPSDYGFPKGGLKTLKCNTCGGTKFEVSKTNSYETSARCSKCGRWFIVHES